jgi:hypothetical protein
MSLCKNVNNAMVEVGMKLLDTSKNTRWNEQKSGRHTQAPCRIDARVKNEKKVTVICNN